MTNSSPRDSADKFIRLFVFFLSFLRTKSMTIKQTPTVTWLIFPKFPLIQNDLGSYQYTPHSVELER